MSRQFAITTSDNPWSPFTHFDEWFAYDYKHGYYTCSYLGRIAPVCDGVSDEFNDSILEETIDDIVARNLIGLETDNKVKYVKVVKET